MKESQKYAVWLTDEAARALLGIDAQHPQSRWVVLGDCTGEETGVGFWLRVDHIEQWILHRDSTEPHFGGLPWLRRRPHHPAARMRFPSMRSCGSLAHCRRFRVRKHSALAGPDPILLSDPTLLPSSRPRESRAGRAGHLPGRRCRLLYRPASASPGGCD